MTKYWKADKDEMIGDMLFDRKETEEVGKMLERMYFKRKIIRANNKRTIRSRTPSLLIIFYISGSADSKAILPPY